MREVFTAYLYPERRLMVTVDEVYGNGSIENLGPTDDSFPIPEDSGDADWLLEEEGYARRVPWTLDSTDGDYYYYYWAYVERV